MSYGNLLGEIEAVSVAIQDEKVTASLMKGNWYQEKLFVFFFFEKKDHLLESHEHFLGNVFFNTMWKM